MGITETVSEVVAPAVAALGVELVDVEQKGVVVRVVVDQPGGISLDRLSEVTHAVSRALDEADPIAGRYTLEVSSPGVERPLRTPRHFAAVVGQPITFRWARDGRPQRVNGTLLAAAEETITVRVAPAKAGLEAETVDIPYAAVDKARTVFEWGPAPKPGKGSKPGAAKASKAKASAVAAPAAPVAPADDPADGSSPNNLTMAGEHP